MIPSIWIFALGTESNFASTSKSTLPTFCINRAELSTGAQASCGEPAGTVNRAWLPVIVSVPSFKGFTNVQRLVFNVVALKLSDTGADGGETGDAVSRASTFRVICCAAAF